MIDTADLEELSGLIKGEWVEVEIQGLKLGGWVNTEDLNDGILKIELKMDWKGMYQK